CPQVRSAPAMSRTTTITIPPALVMMSNTLRDISEPSVEVHPLICLHEHRACGEPSYPLATVHLLHITTDVRACHLTVTKRQRNAKTAPPRLGGAVYLWRVLCPLRSEHDPGRHVTG